MRWVTGEAWRDVTSGTAHALRCALVLAVLVGAPAAAAVAAVAALRTRGAGLRAGG